LIKNVKLRYPNTNEDRNKTNPDSKEIVSKPLESNSL